MNPKKLGRWEINVCQFNNLLKQNARGIFIIAIMQIAATSILIAFMTMEMKDLKERIQYSGNKEPTLKPVKEQWSNTWNRVWATRIGLIGRTTASGSIIKESDIFAALPHRSALKKWINVRYLDKSIKCQILDIGPWSIKDDYWLHDRRPSAEKGSIIPDNGRFTKNKAGIDLSDELWRQLNISTKKGIVKIEWKFLDKEQ